MKKRKRLRKVQRSNSYCNKHHLLWIHKNWSSGYARQLRDCPYFIVSIPANTEHRYIHSNMNGIPVPSGRSCKKAFEQIEILYKHGAIKETDTIQQRLERLIFILDYIEPETVKALRKQLKLINTWERDNKKDPQI